MTINVCSNMNGSIKLPLLVIGMSARSQSFKPVGMNSLPVIYMHHPNTYIGSEIFRTGFTVIFPLYTA